MFKKLAIYSKKLERIRVSFPQPVSDRVHDSYFVHSVMRALDVVYSLKSERLILGERHPLDFSVARQSQLADGGLSVEEVTGDLV